MNWELKQIQPPAARGKFDAKLYKDPDWYAEEKLDGDRRIAQFCGDAHTPDSQIVVFTGRKVSSETGLMTDKTDRLPHLNGCQTRFPADLVGTVLDGEMTVDKPGARSKDVTSIIGSKPADAIKKQQERGWLVYVVFDCLFYKGEDLRELPLIRRRRYLQQVIDEWKNPYVKMVPNTALSGEKPEDMVLRIWKQDGEGIILKDLRSTYGNEKAWVKVKKTFTEDVVVIGYDDPKAESEKRESYLDADGVKRYTVLETSATRLAEKGWIGAIRFGQYRKADATTSADVLADPMGFKIAAEDQPFPIVPKYVKKPDGVYELVYCGSCSGMDDEIRALVSTNKEKHLGQVVEILANEREPTGKFRHPRMVQFRDNKNASDCIWGQK